MVIFFMMLACVLQVAALDEENVFDFSMRNVQACDVLESRAAFERKWFGNDAQVCLVYLRKKELFSVGVDVFDQVLRPRYCSADGSYVECTRRALDVLRDELLKGFVLKPGCAKPCIDDVAFPLSGAPLNLYERKAFSSKILEDFVVKFCVDQAVDRRSCAHHCVPLTRRELQAMTSTVKVLKWIPEMRQTFAQDVFDKKGNDHCLYFMLKGEDYGLRGSLKWSLDFANIWVPEKSLLFYKLQGVSEQMVARSKRIFCDRASWIFH